MRLISKQNWVRLAAALVFIILTVSLSASAQDNSDEPMGEKAAAALVKELDGVVKRLSPDKEEARQVCEKWYKRKNLGKKTRSQVIDLLFEDVKSVIKDSGTQYQIYSTFSFYKNVDMNSSKGK